MVRFGVHSGWESKEVRVRHGCGMWKSIMKVREYFWKFICFKLGLGLVIKFWEDPWVGEIPLNEEFGGLFSLVMDTKVIVADSFDFRHLVWNPRLRRNLFDFGS